MQTYEEGLKHDPENSELQEGIKRCVEMINKGNRGELSEEEMKARQERAMSDPEIQEILGDPVMRQVLQDMQVGASAPPRCRAQPCPAPQEKALRASRGENTAFLLFPGLRLESDLWTERCRRPAALGAGKPPSLEWLAERNSRSYGRRLPN